jgi:hypothetical protein
LNGSKGGGGRGSPTDSFKHRSGHKGCAGKIPKELCRNNMTVYVISLLHKQVNHHHRQRLWLERWPLKGALPPSMILLFSTCSQFHAFATFHFGILHEYVFWYPQTIIHTLSYGIAIIT